MNRLTMTKRGQVLKALVEENAIRSTVRMTGVPKNTVTKLLVDVGIPTVWVIRKRIAGLTGAMDSELHKEACDFAEWLTSHIGRYREVATSESNPSPLQAEPVC